MFVVPAATATSIPALPIVAIPDAELQEPPVVVSLNVVEDPAQRWFIPIIGAGTGSMVSIWVLKQPAGNI